MNNETTNPTGLDDDPHAGMQTGNDQHDTGDAGHRDQEIANAEGTKTAELCLPYLDPVEDMHHCLNDSPSDLDALTALAEDMDWAGDILRAVKDAIAGQETSISTEQRAILVRGPAAVIDDLVDKGHLEKWPRIDEADSWPNHGGTSSTAAHGQRDVRSDDAGRCAPHRGRADETKMAVLLMPYFHQGDDLYECLKETGDLPEALAAHASFMDDAARMLRYLKLVLANRDVSVHASAGCILVSGPIEVIDDLVEHGALPDSQWLAEAPPIRHKTIRVRGNGLDAEIDEEIAPLIRELWKARFLTMMSCQGSPEGWVWIQFPFVVFAEAFMNLIERESGIRTLWQQWRFGVCTVILSKEVFGDYPKELIPEGPSLRFAISVRFPKADLPAVLETVTLHNEKNENTLETD